MPKLTRPAQDIPLALYYALHAVRDGMQRELTMLQKVPSHCRAPLHIEKMEGGRNGKRGRNEERERERGGRGEVRVERE